MNTQIHIHTIVTRSVVTNSLKYTEYISLNCAICVLVYLNTDIECFGVWSECGQIDGIWSPLLKCICGM